MKETIIICGAQRGRWGKPIPYKEIENKIKWVDEKDKPIKPPKKVKCQHPIHSGRRLYYPLSQMCFQEWKMTPEEFTEAVDRFDVFSLEMKSRLICPKCAKKEVKNEGI